MKTILIATLSLMLAFACVRGPVENREISPAPVIHLGTTSSVENSGLLAQILPEFRKEKGIEVRAIAVGSGRALNLARRGDVDAVITHDPAAERAFVDEGHSILYRKIMYNDFVIAGPVTDPADVVDADGVADAMRRIASNRGPFASRGDDSGTHAREKSLWSLAEIQPSGEWYLETGQGMAGTLRVADERHAYVLTDRATLGQLRDSLRLTIVFEGGPELLNPYAVIVARGGVRAKREAALVLARWLSDGQGREAIDRYRVGGAPAFVVWPEGSPREAPENLPKRP